MDRPEEGGALDSGRPAPAPPEEKYLQRLNDFQSQERSALSALGTKAEKDPKHRFRSLAGLLDRQMVAEAFRRLKRRAAPGIYGVTHDVYAENLDESLLNLESYLKKGTYRAQPVKRRWIATPGISKMRPLGIPVLDDINEHSAKHVVKSLFTSGS